MAKYSLNMTDIIYDLPNQTKDQRIAEYRRQASRLVSIANKRISRLEQQNLIDSPAYQKYVLDGGGRFGVRGKSFNELQSEVARLDRFLNAKTSTVSGLKTQLQDMANITGMEYSNINELMDSAPQFFRLADKVEEYLRTVDDMASAIGYQKIWDVINEFTQEEGIDLSDSKIDIDSMVKSLADAAKEYDSPLRDTINETGTNISWYRVKD